MQINSDQLSAHLQKKLYSLYWIAGDDVLLVQEALDRLRSRCRQEGFTEWDLFFIERSFNWQTMLQSGNSLSLFSDRKIIELRLLTPKLEEAGRDAVQQYLASPNPDNILIIVSPKLEYSALSTKWFKAIETAGVFVQVWPVDASGLPRWIATRLVSHGLNAGEEAISLLCEKVEGNLLAANQEIEKLRVLTGASPNNRIHIDTKHIMTLVADSSRYNVFNLIDAALVGDARRCLKIVNGLRSEGSEPLSILGMITRELRSLIAVATRMASGQNASSAMQKEGIRKTHEGPVSRAVERHNLATLEGLLQQARTVDMAVKGLTKADPWTELNTLLLTLGGTRLCTDGFSSDYR
ncbi:MAG: DNA polymerase III subunit delta [Gammaproteobacteria bacterium]|nr:DNA polymerase III subunit delta [Gammaproteobacteria bacterium]MDP2347198.1 DNA polymerase III subunit delta [Gammaproteobacteria bacterium]